MKRKAQTKTKTKAKIEIDKEFFCNPIKLLIK